MPLNLTYAPFKPFQCIVPSQNQQNVKFWPEIPELPLEMLTDTDSKSVALDVACIKHYICTTQAISMHFAQSKSTKCEIFVWNCNFLGTTYHRDSKPVVWIWHASNLKYCTTQAISMHCSQSKSTKCEILAISWALPPDMKKHPISWKECITETCKSARIGFWVCQLQCTMLQLCVTSTFWVINGFSAFVMGSSRYWVLKHSVIKCDSSHYCCIFPSQNQQNVNPICCCLKLWFFMNHLS